MIDLRVLYRDSTSNTASRRLSHREAVERRRALLFFKGNQYEEIIAYINAIQDISICFDKESHHTLCMIKNRVKGFGLSDIFQATDW